MCFVLRPFNSPQISGLQVFFFDFILNNPLSPISATPICMAVGPSTVALSIYHGPHP